MQTHTLRSLFSTQPEPQNQDLARLRTKCINALSKLQQAVLKINELPENLKSKFNNLENITREITALEERIKSVQTQIRNDNYRTSCCLLSTISTGATVIGTGISAILYAALSKGAEALTTSAIATGAEAGAAGGCAIGLLCCFLILCNKNSEDKALDEISALVSSASKEFSQIGHEVSQLQLNDEAPVVVATHRENRVC